MVRAWRGQLVYDGVAFVSDDIAYAETGLLAEVKTSPLPIGVLHRYRPDGVRFDFFFYHAPGIGATNGTGKGGKVLA